MDETNQENVVQAETETPNVSETAQEINTASETPEDKKFIAIDFFKSAIVGEYEKDGKKKSIITFPKFSMYAGYVFHWRTEWIKNSKFVEDKRYITTKPDFEILITKSAQNSETHQWEVVDKQILTADRVREAMRKQPKPENQNKEVV